MYFESEQAFNNKSNSPLSNTEAQLLNFLTLNTYPNPKP